MYFVMSITVGDSPMQNVLRNQVRGIYGFHNIYIIYDANISVR